jgi:hypothetical protein
MIPEQLTRYLEAYERLRRTMMGIASCATRCGCCEMHNRVAKQSLEAADKLVKGDVANPTA